MTEIYERELVSKGRSEPIMDLMTPEQQERGQYYRQQYFIRRGELDNYKTEWDELSKMYDCERDPDPRDESYPNSFIPLMTPVVEGQVASMLETDIEYTYTTNNPAHKEFMTKLDAASKYYRSYNQSERHFKDYARMYDLLGNAWVNIAWEKSISNSPDKPKGYPKISIPPILSVLVDGRIKDFKDLQYAEYIIHEIGFQSIGWARKEYGDDKADAISTLMNRYDGTNTEVLYDDNKTFMLLHIWTRSNEQGNLQLIEMDANGLILRESDPNKPYYEKVDNEYPFYFGRMIPRLGRFYGYGDGKILKPMQECVNKLTDELELACRFSAQSRTYIDPNAGCDVDQLDSDPSHPVMIKNPSQNVYVANGQGINPVVVQMIQFLLEQAQRATRFSDIMTGNQKGSSATATQINGQLTQGSIGIADKKSDIQQAMAWVDRYCLKLCLEKWDIPFWAELGDGKSEYIDMKYIAQAPKAIPLTGDSIVAAAEELGNMNSPDFPEYENLYGEDGQAEMTELDYRVTVTLGSGFPKGKNDQYNQVIGLVQINQPDAMGMPNYLLPIDVARPILEKITGYKLKSEDMPEQSAIPAQSSAMPQTAGVNPLPTDGSVAMPNGSQVSTTPSDLMANVPMSGFMDKRGLA